MFNRFRRKEAQPQNVPVRTEPEPIEKQQGFICPMCMTSLPGPAELQAHFEKVHDESGGGNDPLVIAEDDTDVLPENNEQLLSNISKGSLELDLDSNAPDSEKVILLLQQDLSDKSVELKEEKWYTVQLKTELEKVSAERDKLEEEKQLVEKEYMSQLRSAEEGFFEVVEENKKLKEDLVFADYNTTKERHDKLKQQAIDSQSEVDQERMTREMLEEDNRLLKEKFHAMQNDTGTAESAKMTALMEENKSLREKVATMQEEIEEENLKRDGLEAGIDMLKQQVSSHQTEASEEKDKRATVETELTYLIQQVSSHQAEASEEKEKREAVESQLTSLQDQVATIESAASEERQKREAVENEYIELKAQVNSFEDAVTEEKTKREAVENDFTELKGEKEKVDSELHKVKALLEQEVQKCSSQMASMDDLQSDLNRERERISEMEKDHAEQLNKMEKGDQGAVIQELSMEKQKLLESIASMESTMTLKLKEQSGDIVNIRQEKMEVMVELRESQLEKGKLEEELQSCSEAKKQVGNELATSQMEKENLTTKLKELEELKENISLQLEEKEKEKEKLKEELHDGNEEKEIIMNELRKYQDELKRVEALLLERNEEVDVCKKEISALNAKIKDFETSNANLNGLVLQKEEAINEMKAIHSEAISQMSSQMEEESKKYQSEIASVKKEMEVVSEKLESTSNNLNTSKDEITELNSKIVEYEAKNNALETSLQQKEDVLLEVHSNLEAAEQELKKPCDSCKNYEIQLCRLQEETRDSQGQIETLKKEFQELSTGAEEEKKVLNSTIEQLQADKATLEDSGNASLLKISDLEIAIEGLNSEKELFVESALQAEEKISCLDEEASNLKKELSDLQVELLSQTAEKEEITKELEEKQNIWINERNLLLEEGEELKLNLQKECENHQETKETYQNVEESLRVEISSLQADISELQEKLETSELGHQDAIRSKEELQVNLKKIEGDLSSRTKEIADYEKKLKTLEHQNNELKGDVNVLQVQLHSSNEEKSTLLERVLATEEQHKKTKQKYTDTNRKLDQAYSALQELGQENQNMQVQQVLKSNRQWMQDDECLNCKKCDKLFSFTVRKHHCRHCGYIFCGECSCYTAITASSKKPVRVCESCSTELSSLRGSNVRRLSNASSISSISTR